MNSLLPAVRVRRMTLADLDSVIEIAGSLKEAPHWPRAAYLDAVDPKAARRRIALVAAESMTGTGVPSDRSSSQGWTTGVPSDRSSSQGRSAGFAVASLLAPQAELEMIAVAPAAQRHGLARQIFAALTVELASAGISEIVLEVRASNAAALGLYRRLGFVETGRRSCYYHDPVEDAVLMRLQL